MVGHQLEILAELADEIAMRRTASPEQSYTASLLSQGVEKCAKKLGEEAVETVLAAVMGRPGEVAAETADLLYHLLVTLAAANVELSDVMKELSYRRRMSGLKEKASRPKD